MQVKISLKNRHTQYRILIMLWVFLSIVVGYRYVSSLTTPQTGKGGTFVEATLQQPNYLPYITPHDADKFYQSLLFEGCLYPIFSGTQVTFAPDLCEVRTDDHQTFIVTPLSGPTWKDGTAFSINDIYFTYKSILKDNYRNIPHLAGYSALQVIAEKEEVKVIFPKASKDNMIFFTNFILPAHILANISLEEYMIRFLQDPIGTSCALLQTNGKELNNFIFDLSSCPNFSLKNYQIKWFKDDSILQKFVKENKQIVDFSLDPLPEDIYTPTPILLNNYFTFFINSARTDRSEAQKKGIALLIQQLYTTTTGTEELFVRDPYLFSMPAKTTDEIKDPLLPPKKLITTTGDVGPTPLPPTISRGDTTTRVHTIASGIDTKQTLTMQFVSGFARVSISPNGGKEYFPVSYTTEKKSLQYNLSPLYQTIIPGKNTYTIRGYMKNGTVTTYTLEVWYLEQPPLPEPVVDPVDDRQLSEPFTVIYFENKASTILIDQRKAYLENHGRSDRFVFEGYTDQASLDGKLVTKQYDIVLRNISFGLKKDLSNLLTTDDPIINPSNMIHEELSNLITAYFLANDDTKKATIKEQIQGVYEKNPPLVILGKVRGKMRIRTKGGFTYPEKMYVFGRRKPSLQNIQLFQHINIDWEKASNPLQFLKFLRDSL